MMQHCSNITLNSLAIRPTTLTACVRNNHNSDISEDVGHIFDEYVSESYQGRSVKVKAEA